MAKQHRTFVSNLTQQPDLRSGRLLSDLYRMENKTHFFLKDWEEAVSYLLGCTVHFQDYEEIGKSLKPFSLQVR